MPIRYRLPGGTDEEYKPRVRPPMPKFVTTADGRRVRVPQASPNAAGEAATGLGGDMGAQMGILSAPTTGMMFSHPLVGKLTSPNDLVASEEDQLQGALSNLGEAMPQVQPAPTNAQRDLDRAIQQRKQATNARWITAGYKPPYPEAMPQQAQPGQMGAEATPGAVQPVSLPLVNMPVHGITEGVPIPRDKFGQRLFFADYSAALQLNKARNLAGDKDLRGREKAIGDLESFGDFSYLDLDSTTTARFRQLAEAGKKSIAPGAAYARIVDLIHAHRADIHAAEQRKASQERQEAGFAHAEALQAAKEAKETATTKAAMAFEAAKVIPAKTKFAQAEKSLTQANADYRRATAAHNKAVAANNNGKLSDEDLDRAWRAVEVADAKIETATQARDDAQAARDELIAQHGAIKSGVLPQAAPGGAAPPKPYAQMTEAEKDAYVLEQRKAGKL